MLIEKLLKVALLGSSWVMYLMLILSVFSIATMIERWFFFRKRNDDIDELGESLIAALAAGDRAKATALLKASPSIEATVMTSAMRYIDAGPDAVEDAIESSMIRERHDMERGSTLLGTLGNNAPFIGLFGTIIGVIIAFRQLGESQGASSMSAVMGGIAEALVATGVGLFVAIPAVVGYNIIQKAIGDIENNVASLGKELTALLKGVRDRAAQGSSLMASSLGRGGGRRGGITGINVTPMVDVVLVLLVIMMVSAIYIVSQALKVELPKTASSDEPASSPLIVTVTKTGSYLYNQKPIEESALPAAFRQAKKENKDASLVLTADREAFHGDVVHVIDLAKVEGITKFAITVDRSK